jgi:hypothetical protein
MPTGLRIGDVLLMHANVSSGTITISNNATGWEELSHLSQALTNVVESYVWAIRVTDIGMLGPELTRTGGDYMIARIWVVSSVNGTTATDGIVGSRNTLSGGSVFTLSHTTFNTTEDDATIVYIGQTGFDGTGSDMSNDVDDSASNVLGAAVLAYDGTTTGNGGGYTVAQGYLRTAGATGQLDWMHGSAKSWCKHAFAFQGTVQNAVAPVITEVTIEGAIDYNDPIEVGAVDDVSLSSVIITATYGADYVGGAITETVYDGTAFSTAFLTDSTVTGTLVAGLDFYLDRDGGWPSEDVDINVIAVDAQGNVATDTFTYTTNFVPVPIDAVPPTITNFVPPINTDLDKMEPIQFDVLDDLALGRILLEISFLGIDMPEPIYNGNGFTANYSNGENSVTPISGGFRFTVLRNGGWPSTQITVTPYAHDTSGNENT